jgi:hypothetical protein
MASGERLGEGIEFPKSLDNDGVPWEVFRLGH